MKFWMMSFWMINFWMKPGRYGHVGASLLWPSALRSKIRSVLGCRSSLDVAIFMDFSRGENLQVVFYFDVGFSRCFQTCSSWIETSAKEYCRPFWLESTAIGRVAFSMGKRPQPQPFFEICLLRDTWAGYCFFRRVECLTNGYYWSLMRFMTWLAGWPLRKG